MHPTEGSLISVNLVFWPAEKMSLDNIAGRELHELSTVFLSALSSPNSFRQHLPK